MVSFIAQTILFILFFVTYTSAGHNHIQSIRLENYMSSIPSIYAPMLKSYLKNQTNQKNKINSTQKGDNDCRMSRGDFYGTTKIKENQAYKKRGKKVIYREIPQLEVDGFKEGVGAVIQKLPQLFLPPPTCALPHLFLPIATNTMGKELDTMLPVIENREKMIKLQHSR